MDALKRGGLPAAHRPCSSEGSKPTCTGGDDSSSSSSQGHRDDEGEIDVIYGAMERTFRAQVELLHTTADRRLRGLADRRVGGGDDDDEDGTDDEDDGMEGELGRLGEAERAMREELACAVSDFGSSSSPSLLVPAYADEESAEQQQQVGGVTAASVDTRELNAALDGLCRWLREGGEHKSSLDEQARSYPRHPTPRGDRRVDIEPNDSDDATLSHKDQTRSNFQEIVDRRTPPLDELCQWLRDSDKHLNPRPYTRLERNFRRHKGDGFNLRRSDSDRENRSSLDNKLAVADDEETPHTFHLHNGGASSLLVLGAAGHRVRAPKGRSPLR